tara:strand:- start:43 stop:489 length:447 start_codon:yes stop_codon:yes gene_type:complete
MSSARLRRQQKRAEKKGLLWSSDKSVRSAAWKAGFRAITLDSEPMALADFFNEGFSLDTIASFIPSKEEREATFREAWNAVIKAAELPEPNVGTESRPRKQVDIGTVGSTLPAQAIGMISPAQDQDQWKAWIVPALGLVAAFYLWRRS